MKTKKLDKSSLHLQSEKLEAKLTQEQFKRDQADKSIAAINQKLSVLGKDIYICELEEEIAELKRTQGNANSNPLNTQDERKHHA